MRHRPLDDSDGKTINKQIVTPDLIRQLAVVAALLDVAMRVGPEVAKVILDQMNDNYFSERT